MAAEPWPPSHRRDRSPQVGKSPAAREILAFLRTGVSHLRAVGVIGAETTRHPSRARSCPIHLRDFVELRGSFAARSAPAGDRGKLAPCYTNSPAIKRTRPPCHPYWWWSGRIRRASRKSSWFRQSLQSARPMSGRPCGPRRPACNRNCAADARKAALRSRARSRRAPARPDAPVARFLQVGGDSQNEPERIVVEPAADISLPRLVSGWYW